jgi:uracil-DNA glycosylase family 4
MSLEDCRKCPSLVSSRARIVKGYGDMKASIMFVGLAPGRKGADQTGVPFTRDRSGLLFQEALIKGGFSLESDPTIEKPRLVNAYVTNIVKCNPKDEKGNNRYPNNLEILNCMEYFNIEKSMINPKIIIMLGKISTENVLQIRCKNFLDFHNKSILKEGIKYIPFIHPSFIIRGSYNKEKYLEDFSKLRGEICHS